MDHHLMTISVFICICSASVAMVGNDALLFGIFDNVRARIDAPLAAKKNHLLFSYLSKYQNSILLRAAHTNRQPTWKRWQLGVDASWWPSKRFVQGTKILRPTWLWVSCMIYKISKNWFPGIHFQLWPFAIFTSFRDDHPVCHVMIYRIPGTQTPTITRW